MKAKIIEKQEVKEGSLFTKFSLDEEINFKAGQFFRLTLINPPYTDNRGNGRFLGFINSPSHNREIETATRLGPSAFKRSLLELGTGTEVEIGAVGGEMTIPEDSNTNCIIVTGGIGIVPYMSMFRMVKEKSLQNKFTVVYSNTKLSWALYMDELQSYANENPNFKLITTITKDPDWQGENRRIDQQFLGDVLPNRENGLFYISGTPRFVPSVVTAVKALGVPQDKLKFEIFTGY